MAEKIRLIRAGKEGLYKRRRAAQKSAEPEAAAAAAETVELTPHQARLAAVAESKLAGVKARETGIEFSFKGVFKLPSLPSGYFFKGGAAREVLRRSLFPQRSQLPLRDLDIVRFTETGDSEDHRLALQYMAQDYEFGRGVEVCVSLVRYYATRDLTVNQALYAGGTVQCSYAAFEDTLNGILRPTSYVLDGNGCVESRTLLKIVRLAAEAAVHHLPAIIMDCPRGTKVMPFDVALQLDRALEQSTAVAHEYILLAWQHALIRPGTEAPPPLSELVLELAQFLAPGIGFFKNLPMDVLKELAARGVSR